MKIEASQEPAATLSCDLLVVGAQNPQDPAVEALASHYPGLVQALEGRRFKGKVGTSVLLPGLAHLAARDLLVVGTGEHKPQDFQDAAAHAGKTARSQHARHVGLSLGSDEMFVLEYLDAGNYVFDPYLAKEGRAPAIEQVSLLGTGPHGSIPNAQARMAARRLTRDLVNGPPADIYPDTLAETARAMAQGIDHLEVEVWDHER